MCCLPLEGDPGLFPCCASIGLFVHWVLFGHLHLPFLAAVWVLLRTSKSASLFVRWYIFSPVLLPAFFVTRIRNLEKEQSGYFGHWVMDKDVDNIVTFKWTYRCSCSMECEIFLTTLYPASSVKSVRQMVMYRKPRRKEPLPYSENDNE